MATAKGYGGDQMTRLIRGVNDLGVGHQNATGLREPCIVIAIDFGTYASGYAFQWRTDFKQDRTKIYCNTKWDVTGLSLATFKTLTSLLLNADKSVCKFGYDAEYTYTELGNEDGKYAKERRQDWFLFRQFKMSLYNREYLSNDTPIEGEGGNSLPAIEVFSRSIEYMRNHVIGRIREGGVTITVDEIKWVITVPAIWDEAAKSLMKRAAIKAGIQADRLTIALESECAAIYCSQISQDQMKVTGDGGKLKYIAAPGSTVMVVDIGGGTVDVTTVQINDNGTMRQAYISEGGPWGGKNVNDRFFAMIRELLGEEVLIEFRRDFPEEDYEMSMDFETQKRKVMHPDVEENDDRFRIKLPSNLKAIWDKKNTGKQIGKMLKESGRNIIFTRGKLSFDIDIIRDFFTETITEIENNVDRVLGTPEHNGIKIDALILVGGFAESQFVVRSLRESLVEKNIPLVRPEQTELAVLYGAVLFGHDEEIITSRKLRHTFGVGMVMEFKNGVHDPVHKFEDSGQTFANNVFRKHVVKGQEVKFSQWIAGKTYEPVYEGQESAEVHVFSSDKTDPIHTTENGCKFIGSYVFKFPALVEGAGTGQTGQRAVEVWFKFGGTHLMLRTVDKTTGCRFEKTMLL